VVGDFKLIQQNGATIAWSVSGSNLPEVGPILRNKIFFFFGYQGTETIETGKVPTGPR